MPYASGKYSIAECPRCQGVFPHNDLVQDPNIKMRVCRSCLDKPDFKPFRPPVDPQNLRWAQPLSSEGTPEPYTLPFDPYDHSR